MSKPDELDNGPPFRPTMGRRVRARDRVASGSLVIGRLVRHGHGRRGPGRARRGQVPGPAPGFAPKRSARRVVIKAHVQHLSRNGAQAATRHLRYIERDGVEKDGSPGVLYGPDGPVVRETFEGPHLGERHQFRFILSPEDGHDLDLTAYCRSLMSRVERDLGRRIEWAAVNHYDTDHPHAHVVVRGVDRDGAQLFIERAYIARGMRWSARELATDWLGPRLESEIQQTYDREVAQERLTSLDRELARLAQGRRVDVQGFESRAASPPPEVLVRRLEQLGRLGLAERVHGATWELADGWQDALRELGFRGDRLKQIHRALHGTDPARVHVVGPGQGIPDGRGGVVEGPVVGRLARKGLADESKGTYYAVIETAAGAVYHVPLPARGIDELQPGALVTFWAKLREPGSRPVDRHPAPNPLEKIKPRQRAPGYQLSIEPMALSLDQQVIRRGPVWLDEVHARTLHGQGFGADVLAAVGRRREVLRRLGIAPEDPERVAKLREMERRAVGEEVARCGEAFLEPTPDRFRGRVRGPLLDRTSSYVAVSDGRSFVLVEATPEIRALTGRDVELRRAADGRVVLRDETARRELGEALARTTQGTFLPQIPDGFRGIVREGPSGGSHLVISDGIRFVLVPDSAEARVLLDKCVEVARDRNGLFLSLRPDDRHRGLSR
jgi:type IV secretory pathway VirD2 relaxase